LDSRVKTGALFHKNVPILDIISNARAIGVDEIGVFWFSIPNKEFVIQIKNEGFKLHCFNPDNEQEVRKCLDLGVDGMGSNKTTLLVKLLSNL